MKYEYKEDSENQTLNVITIGDLSTNEVAAMGLNILMIAKKKNYKIIFDYRLSKNRISIAEAYFWHSSHYDRIDIKLRCIPTTYIANNSDWVFFHSLNAPEIIKVFR